MAHLGDSRNPAASIGRKAVSNPQREDVSFDVLILGCAVGSGKARGFLVLLVLKGDFIESRRGNLMMPSSLVSIGLLEPVRVQSPHTFRRGRIGEGAAEFPHSAKRHSRTFFLLGHYITTWPLQGCSGAHQGKAFQLNQHVVFFHARSVCSWLQGSQNIPSFKIQNVTQREIR